MVSAAGFVPAFGVIEKRWAAYLRDSPRATVRSSEHGAFRGPAAVLTGRERVLERERANMSISPCLRAAAIILVIFAWASRASAQEPIDIGSRPQLFLDTRPDVDPKERYKAIAGYPGPGNKSETGAPGKGLYGFVSPDGIHWTKT